jgi:predicted phage-related endonuclease
MVRQGKAWGRTAMIERIPITDRASWLVLRRQDVTASTAGALLGVDPYKTAYGLWAEKSGAITETNDPTPAMRRGLALEDDAIDELGRLHPDWQLSRPNAYYRDPEKRLGATPDCLAIDPERPGLGVIQVKTSNTRAFDDDWMEDGAPPLWIVVQTLIEAHLTGASWAAIAALEIGQWHLHLVEVPLHAPLIARVEAEVAAFWRMIDEGREPPADYGRDAALIEQLYKPIPDEILDLTASNELPALLDERESLSEIRTATEKRLKEIKGELIANLKDYSAGRVADGRIITAKRIHKKAYEVPATSYVDVRVKAP